MLVITSLIYVLLSGVYCFTYFAIMQLPFSYSLLDFYSIAHDLYSFVFVYNFYVYLITGKQFRAELHKLFCACCRRCRSSSSSSSAAAAAAAANDDVRAVRRGQADTAV